MKKSYYVYCSMAVSAIIFSLYCLIIFSGTPISSQGELLSAAFDQSGAKVVRSEIYGWGNLSGPYGGWKELEELALNICRDLGAAGDKRISTQQEPVQKIEVTGVTSDDVQIAVNVQVSNTSGNPGERIISVGLKKDLSKEGLEEVRRRVADILGGYGIKPKVNSLITGSYEGKLDYAVLNEKLTHALNGIEAGEVDGVREDSLISLSAYTPHLRDYIKVNGRKMNVNFAARYNSFEDKTFIWFASPVIAIEY